MTSRIPLLFAVLAAACLGFGSAEGDPLPAAVVELVKSGSVSSMQDLQFLLFSESIEVDPDNHNDSSNRLPRSLLDAQPAQQAVCKVRTEVTEVTRSMLDRSNANFLLWPPCVEVQRCSGCCNTKSLQCVPVLTHTRYLQVMKIQYVNKRPLYDKAVISVLDHVECRCQPAPRPAQRKKSSTSKQDRPGKSRSKGDLHHRDEFKHNQKLSLEDLLTHSWIPKDRLPESGAPDAFLPSGDFKPHLGRDGWGLNETQYGGGKSHHHYPVDARRHHGNANDTGVGSAKRMTFPLPNYTEQEEIEKDDSSLSNLTKAVERERSDGQVESQNNANQSIINQTSEYKTTAMELTNKTLKRQSNLTQETPDNFAVGTNQMDRPVSNSTEKIYQNGGDLGLSLEEDNKTSDVERRDDEREGNGMNFSPERKAKDEEMEDLLLLHKLLDDEEKHKHHLKAQQSNREHDEKLREFNHKQHTATQQTGTISPPPQRSPPRTPPRPPPHPPKRRRKQRNRISKSAMRALLM